MTLLTAGYWPTTYWAEDYWADGYWQDYGLPVPWPGQIIVMDASRINPKLTATRIE